METSHSAKPAEDLEDISSIRFFLRGDKDLVECLISWQVLDRLENGKAAARPERLARFEIHRSAIENAARKKLATGHDPDTPLVVEAGDVLADFND